MNQCLFNYTYIFLALQKNYLAAWEADKIKTHVTPDLPELVLSKANAQNISKVH